jgi:hypothetical protein
MGAYRTLTRWMGGGLAVAVSLGMPARAAEAQTVQGRVVELPGAEPIAGALVALMDSTGREIARSASSPSGGFIVAAGAAGRYHVLIRQIGRLPWRSPAFDLAAGATYPVMFRVDAQVYELPTITVEAKRSRCGARPGDEGIVGGLLEAADVALQLARATADEGRLAFSTASYLKQLGRDLRMLDSTSTGVSRLASWPIESAHPDSLRAWGFVRQPPPRERATTAEGEAGPIYYAPDARVLFSDWFLASHCFQVAEEDEGDVLEVRFTPERKRDRAEIDGRLVLDRRTLELRRLEFEYVGLPRWIPKGKAGGFVELSRLRSGAWVPRAWALRAPLPVRAAGSATLKVGGWLETGGHVIAVRTPRGELDSAATRQLLEP